MLIEYFLIWIKNFDYIKLRFLKELENVILIS